MDIESTLQLLRQANEYEAYITLKLTMKTSILQKRFFNFDVTPKIGVNKCVGITSYIHEVNGTYYLFSQLFNRYRQTQQVFNSLKRRCPETSMWIRPVTAS
ncbi:hypothetical protein H735_18750 [Vibrio owensii CAIM 1854 = LMG 25443]|uniref:Uncharacterized protein n=1 Tax=Vibrio owensii CAIM 1854 = LMG 25443 TaxID=1229493 RepID=A0A0C1Z5Z4_9VIBR|nr:hypothetical protein H735_18750 [Vibrio owensii CAIM 1854 = LMG 25443]